MRRNRLWKQVFSVILAATMVFSLPSQAVFAEDDSTDMVLTGVQQSLELDGTETAEMEETKTGATDDEVAVEETENSDTEVAETEGTEAVEETEELEVIDEAQNATAAKDFGYYEDVDGTITITKYYGSDTEVVIPETIDGKSVTSIGATAFSMCRSLTSIGIPSSVTSIGEYTFSGCSGLTSIGLPSGVTSIGDGAFSECSGLTSIELPSGVTSIEEQTFKKCSSLTSIEIPSSVTSIGAGAFEECSSLTSIEIPPSVTSIGYSAFYECSSLTSIEIPPSVTSIGYSAFYECSSLTSIKIPPSVTSIEEQTFEKCSSLTSIELPSEVTGIGNYAFSGCSGLTSIELPSGVTSIGAGAFEKCSGLTSIGLPLEVTSIGAEAFSECSSLTSIKIPSGVTSIGESAFQGCSSLTSIELPSSVTSIGAWAFSECAKITIYCEENSYAKQYAIDHGIPYQLKVAYTVKFNGNGADSGSVANQKITYGSKTALSANKFQKKGYSFKGWNTKKDGTGTTYADKADGSKLTKTNGATVTLYAQWTANKYTITFNGNGSTSGSMKKLTSLKYGKTYTLTKNSYKKKGYTFKGWTTKKDGSGKTYKNKAEIKNLSAKSGGKVTLYAKWSKTKYTITYNLNKGKNNKNNSSSYNITTKTIKLKSPTRKGYTFKGWYSDKKCTKKVTQIKKGSTGNVTLYAKWAKKK